MSHTHDEAVSSTAAYFIGSYKSSDHPVDAHNARMAIDRFYTYAAAHPAPKPWNTKSEDVKAEILVFALLQSNLKLMLKASGICDPEDDELRPTGSHFWCYLSLELHDIRFGTSPDLHDIRFGTSRAPFMTASGLDLRQPTLQRM